MPNNVMQTMNRGRVGPWFSLLLLFVFLLEGMSGEMKGLPVEFLPAGGLGEIAVGKARNVGISAWGQR